MVFISSLCKPFQGATLFPWIQQKSHIASKHHDNYLLNKIFFTRWSTQRLINYLAKSLKVFQPQISTILIIYNKTGLTAGNELIFVLNHPQSFEHIVQAQVYSPTWIAPWIASSSTSSTTTKPIHLDHMNFFCKAPSFI